VAKKIKIGYFDEEFRKTKMGRTASTQNKYVEYQKRLAERLAVPSTYLQAADALIKKQGKLDPVTSAIKSGARGKGVTNPEAAIRGAEFAGYSGADAQGIVRRAAGNTGGTKLGS
tara:strand:+ start:1155 stop:1499 length:345 start_codon:yes stop_codon:yes gene_type:complete